jgi:hypothetical protein
MSSIPHEFVIGGIYMPPLLVAGLLGLAASSVTTLLLNRYRLSRFFADPPLASLALAVIYTILIGTFFIKV